MKSSLADTKLLLLDVSPKSSKFRSLAFDTGYLAYFSANREKLSHTLHRSIYGASSIQPDAFANLPASTRVRMIQIWRYELPALQMPESSDDFHETQKQTFVNFTASHSSCKAFSAHAVFMCRRIFFEEA